MCFPVSKYWVDVKVSSTFIMVVASRKTSRVYIIYQGRKWQQDLLIKIYSLFFITTKCQNCFDRSIDRSKELLWITPCFQIYSRLSNIFREPCFFVILSREPDTEQTYNPGTTWHPSWLISRQCDLFTLLIAIHDWLLCSKTSVIIYFFWRPHNFPMQFTR